MSQSVTAAASLGAPRRHRDASSQQQDGLSNCGVVGSGLSGGTNSGGVGTSISARFGETEWEARESQRQRELEEARARAAQMEKTMKWWSDCTANWREKWSKVRNERNKARDEAKQLRTNLEAAIKESNSYKREKNDLELQISQLKKEMEKIHMLLIKHAGQFDKTGLDGGDEPERDNRESNGSPDISSDGLKNVNSEDGLVIKVVTDHSETRDLDIEEYILQGAVPKHAVEILREKDDRTAEERRLIQQLSKEEFDEDYLLQKISMLQLRLEEAQKTIQIERDEKNSLHKNLEKVTLEVQEVKDKCEELRSTKQDAVRELLTLQEQHRAEVRISNNALQEETNAREALERRLYELRGELERMQAENAAEWGKRERLETEKLALERDNKKMRAEIRDLQERVERRGRPVANTDVELRSLQQELAEKNKEISDIRHSHSKLKKLLAEANTELGHAVRRAEQYETEVKRLRSRVEELKRELAGAEDELDAACNHVRRLQRTNEELTSQTEGLQVQNHHLQTRSSTSPKQHQLQQQQQQHGFYNSPKPNLSTSEYKPNINDLRQLFDDGKHIGSDIKRFNNDPRFYNYSSSQHHQHQHQHQQKQNINDLKQQQHQSSSAALYHDAKTTYIENDNIFESKTSSSNNAQRSANMFDFERAKQKFDKNNKQSSSNSSKQNISNKIPISSAGNSGGGGINLSKRNTFILESNNSDLAISKQNFNETVQFFDENLRKKEAYMKTSLNLDGLKVSDDDTP